MTTEEMQAKMEIRELVDRFSSFETDVESQSKLFTPDTHVQVFAGEIQTHDIHGVEELKRAFGGAVQSVKRSQHMNGQQVVTLHGDRAEGKLYCRMALVSEEEGQEFLTDYCVIYDDTYAKLDGRWLIASRISHFVVIDKHPLKS